MTIQQQRRQKRTPFAKRAFDTAHEILEFSGLRYQSGQIDGLATILMAYAENEIRLWRRDVPQAADAVGQTPSNPI